MDYKQIIGDLKSGKYAPIYFLHGEEPYFIDRVSDYIENNILTEGEKSFNQIVLYGKETEFKQVLDQSMQFPMMAQYRVVILKEAQSMSGLENLSGYFNNPSPQTILVIAHKYKKVDKRKKKLWSALQSNAVILESKKLYDNQIPHLIQDICKDSNLKINGRAAFVLSEHLGNDISKISNEIEKLALNLTPGSEIQMEDIHNYVGISKDFNIFELQKAIGTKDKIKAYSIAKYFSQNKKAHPIQMNVGSLYNYFTTLFLAKKYEKSPDKTLASKARINPYFVKEYKAAAQNYSIHQIHRAFRLLNEMDKSSKGVGKRRIDDLGMYQEFLFKLFS